MNCSTPGLPVHYQDLEFTQTHVHRVSDAIQPSHPLSSPSPPAPNPSQPQGLFQRANSLHEVAKVWSFSFSISPLEVRQYQRRSNYCTIEFISHASKVTLKILQARFQQYANLELPDVQAGFRKGRTRNQFANIHWIIEKERGFQKNIYFCFTDYAKTLDRVNHNKLWNILKEMGVPNHLTWETCMQVKKQE